MENKKQSLPIISENEACFREPEEDGTWTCVNDHTGCIWNDGHNECFHEGDKASPLEEE